MDYFVVAKDTPYFHWQLALLIESFKFHSLEDSLTVALAPSEEPSFKFQCLLESHKKLVRVPADGVAALNHCLRHKLIKQPLVVMEPPVVLYKPVNPFKGFLYQEDSTVIHSLEHKLGLPWLMAGRVFGLYGFSAAFFQYLETLVPMAGLDQQIRYSLMLAAPLKSIKVTRRRDLELGMLRTQTGNFIHYEHGMPSEFHRALFTYKAPHYISFGGPTPFDVLAKMAPTPAAQHIQMLAKRILDSGLLRKH